MFSLNSSQDTSIVSGFESNGHSSCVLQEVRTEFGLTVFYDGLYSAAVFVDPNFSNKLCGLCGNYDGLYLNDALDVSNHVEIK